MEAVLQFAERGLGFAPEDTVLFAWSIGGFSATWASMNAPVAGVVLDATFHDLLPLAVPRMPQAWAGLVRLRFFWMNLEMGKVGG